MPNTFTFRTYPNAGSGISVVANASSWVFGSWVEAVKKTRNTSFLHQFTFAINSIGSAVDVTNEILFEIGFGAVGDEYTVAQIPYSFRPDTQVGIYLQSTLKIFFPEVIYCPPGTRIAIRVANSHASANTYSGVRIGYQIDTGLYPETALNNFEKLKYITNRGLSVNVGK